MEIIERPTYIDRVRPYIGKSLIKVLIGHRRVGKSYLLMQLQDIIRAEMPDVQIVYINKEQHEYASIVNAEALFQYLDRHVEEQKRVAIFIDEIQDIDGFEKVLRDLATRDRFDIYCTGSNANLLSGELATYLGGRYIEIKVHGLSYAEHLRFHQAEDTPVEFQRYLQFGGLPYLIHLPSDATVVNGYLSGIYNSILLKDVVSRFGLRNVAFLENLAAFVADNVGSLVSSKKISDYLKSQGVKISPQVVIDYLSYLEASMLISKVKRSGIQGKRIFEVGEKYFFDDLGVRNTIVGYKPGDVHKLLENVVYLHLKIAGYAVTVGQEDNMEIDFIAQKGGEKMYIQVTYLLGSEQTIEREFGNLLAVKDNYPKYVLSMDGQNFSATYQGIRHQQVREFCRDLI